VLAVLGPAFVELLGGPPERLGDVLERALDRGQEQLALALKEAEHVRLRHADPPRDALDGCAVQAAARELVHGRADELLAALGRGHAPARAGLGGVHARSPRDLMISIN